MKRMLLAFQFLTIIPLRDMGEVPDGEMGRATAFFPLVGFAEGLLTAFAAALLLRVFPAEITNALIVAVLIVINGGLHLDGLADTVDAIASRGNREKKLAIMKDSSIGPSGVISIVMALLLKYVLLNAVFFHSDQRVYLTALILMPPLSRWAMVSSACFCKTAGQDGLGKIFIENTATGEFLKATAMVILSALLVCGLTSQFAFFTFYIMFLLPVLFMLSFSALWFFKNYFGGMTGDSFGAVHEGAVLLLLALVVVWLREFI